MSKIESPGRVIRKEPNVVGKKEQQGPVTDHLTFGMRAPIMDLYRDSNNEQRYFVPYPFPLLDDILTRGPEKVMQEEYRKASVGKGKSADNVIRWIHIPLNTMSWVEVRR